MKTISSRCPRAMIAKAIADTLSSNPYAETGTFHGMLRICARRTNSSEGLPVRLVSDSHQDTRIFAATLLQSNDDMLRFCDPIRL